MSIASALSTTIGSQSASTLVLSGLLAVIIAIFGYRLSQRVRATRGVTPWRIPSVIWALICFFFAPFGFALELIAIASTRSETGKIQSANGAHPGPQTAASASTMYSPSAPSSTEEAIAAYRPKIPASGYGGPPSDQVGKPALFGWYRDVTGRHQLRYWDGRDWTSEVADGGVLGTDSLPAHAHSTTTHGTDDASSSL